MTKYTYVCFETNLNNYYNFIHDKGTQVSHLRHKDILCGKSARKPQVRHLRTKP